MHTTIYSFIRLFFIMMGNFALAQGTALSALTPKVESNINIPIRLPLVDLNAMVNKVTPELLYEDNSFSDNNNDQFKIKVWKTRPIRLVSGTQQNFLVEVPIKIWAEKGIGSLGVYTYQNTTFETVMYFNSKITLNNNWILSAKTLANGYKWVQKPELDFGAVKIPITPLVEKSLKKEQEKICTTIDEQIAQSMNFQKNALDIWNSFHAPYLINQEYTTWLKITPQKIKISPLQFYKDEIQSTIGITLITETFVGEKPQSNQLEKTIQNFELGNITPGKFNLTTTAIIPVKEAEAIAKKQFLNKEFDFREGKSKVKITDILLQTNQERMTITAALENAIDGTVIISGIPQYSTEKRKIVLTDIQFKLKTSNFLHKMGVALFKRKIINTIEEQYGIPMTDLEEAARKNIENSFNKELYKGVSSRAKVYQLSPNLIQLNPEHITVFIHTEAQLNISLNKTIL